MQISIPSANILADIPFWVSVDSFLDEELDSCPLSIENTDIPTPLPRFTPAVLLVEREDPTYWMIGSDTVSTGPNGKSQHVVQLIEPTKWLERFMVGNKAVTQPLYVDYLKNRTFVQVESKTGITSATLVNSGTTLSYQSPFSTEQSVPVYSPANFKEVKETLTALSAGNPANYAYTTLTLVCTVKNEYGEVRTISSHSYTKKDYEEIPEKWFEEKALVYLSPLNPGGVYQVEYQIVLEGTKGDENREIFFGAYKIASVANTAGKERTLKDAALSMIYAAESLNESEAPTFYLNEELAAYLETITAPEITVTNATLREALDEIAKYVGAITRLDILPPPQDGGEFRYEINFEKYCKDTEADTSQLGNPVGDVTRSVSCEDYCTALDSTADNVVNYEKGGAISDPHPQFFRTTRSEDASYRVTEGSAKVVTSFPIERVDKIICRIYSTSKGAIDLDLTPYLFESTEYGALSAYDDTYPYTKAYALCYTLGQKNITGLDFTAPNPVHEIFENPAIVNIINREIDAKGYKLDKYGNKEGNPLDFTTLLFRVTYVPTGTLRIRMRKPNSYGKPESVLAFNQSAAKLDAKAFGRSMFGSVLRMGNEITTYQYTPPLGAKVPQKGERFGENGYVSEVHVEYRVSHKTVTIEVSEGFNRLSQFVGVNKTQRIFEISERMSLDRHIVYEDLCLIGTKPREGKGSLVTDDFLGKFQAFFTNTGSGSQSACVMARGYDEEGGALAPCMLPALCYGTGNALTYTASFEDNYGAGRRIEVHSKEGGTGFYALESDVRYTDLFGRIKAMDFSVMHKTYTDINKDLIVSTADDLPRKNSDVEKNAVFYVSTWETNRLKIDKDSRERIAALTYQVSFLEADGVIISPLFAENLPFVPATLGNLKIAVMPLNRPVNNLTEFLDLKGAQTEIYADRKASQGFVKAYCTMKEGGAGWAVVAFDPDEPIQPNGYCRARFLFGKNGPVDAGDTVSFYLTFFRKNNIKEV